MAGSDLMASEGFARRLVDTDERVPSTQLIVRLVPESLAELLTEKAPGPIVTSGEFGKALSDLDPPPDVARLLGLSPSFLKMANNLDTRYVDIWLTQTKERVIDLSPDGVVISGRFTGRRSLKVGKSYTSSSWFEPYSLASPGYYDGIYIEKINPADIGRWIEIIAHETAHAFRFANGQITSSRVTCPQSRTAQADAIRASITDEILARKIETQVLKEIQAASGGTMVKQYQPTTGSTDKELVERDFLSAHWDGTYLEHFVLETLVQGVIVCDKLDENTIREKNFNVGRIDLSKRKLEEYLIDQDYFDPDSGKLTKFATKYARLRFIQRVIDARWKEFKQQHSPNNKGFAKEKVLQEHASAFFQGLIKYTPLKP